MLCFTYTVLIKKNHSSSLIQRAHAQKKIHYHSEMVWKTYALNLRKSKVPLTLFLISIIVVINFLNKNQPIVKMKPLNKSVFNGTNVRTRVESAQNSKDVLKPVWRSWKQEMEKNPDLENFFEGKDDNSLKSINFHSSLLPIASETRFKRILLYNGLKHYENFPMNREPFSKCPVYSCELSSDTKEINTADAVWFDGPMLPAHHPTVNRPKHQIWIWKNREPPHKTRYPLEPGVINWTMTYRRDSEFAFQYRKWVLYKKTPTVEAKHNYAANRTKKVAMLVSNCHDRSNRLNYAKILARYISVDIFGRCGKRKCPENSSKCLKMLSKVYKFYLAFENSNCRDYITEKLFQNGFMSAMIPIVLGAPRVDYERLAPPNSFVHVDDFPSPEQLALYLNHLDANDELYNQYFRWQNQGKFAKGNQFCFLCDRLHDPNVIPKVYNDLKTWWSGPGACISE